VLLPTRALSSDASHSLAHFSAQVIKVTAFSEGDNFVQFHSETLYFDDAGVLVKREFDQSGAVLKGHRSFGTTGALTFNATVPAPFVVDQFGSLPDDVWSSIAVAAKTTYDTYAGRARFLQSIARRCSVM